MPLVFVSASYNATTGPHSFLLPCIFLPPLPSTYLQHHLHLHSDLASIRFNIYPTLTHIVF